MRQWTPTESRTSTADVADLIDRLGEPGFEQTLLSTVGHWLPVSSLSIYRVGGQEPPRRFMSCSLGIPDTTQSCWQAYLTGPYQHDRTFEQHRPALPDGPTLCHIRADEIPAMHRALVYEPFGMAERVSVVDQSSQGVFAINFYRHQHKGALSERHLGLLHDLAPTLLALTRKHLQLAPPVARQENDWSARLLRLCPELTARERQVCARLLQGLTHDGIAQDLGVGLPTVKTYRNRAFKRLGIHFRSELFNRVMQATGSPH
jgi:DNA-binding CsgD family transcriptional regulator